ncbi:RNA polymerase sigma factor [Streptomonospora nanhaiensis]|uniref:RNA polymerase sigma factor n=1 Tax=Streptomonospora nanhaiensis TaxID=1323731 RepID=UPI001C37F33E|nr:hypothetical protein [Streptomonospora nanhaiensis]MBV2365918.1 hypothetical protein [Streptomonospora nanhaiensis]
MTAHSTDDRAEGSGGPSASRRAAGRHSAVPAAEMADALRRGTRHGWCYDLLATRLYRYCWSLLGPAEDPGAPDPAAEAVHEAFLAATHHIGALADDDDLVPWLFALVRAAARRRGFCAESPYARLPVMPRERAAVELSRLLPPSRRELLELYLRHNVPTAQIARVAGLGPDTAADLCRTAVLHAADLLVRHRLAPGDAAGRGPDRGVRDVLALLEPPAPPRALRERVLHDCASPLKGAERRAAADALAPLGADGFPLHRDRTAAAGAAAPAAAPAADGGEGADGGDGARESAAALPRDRVTTRDVPVPARAEALARPAPDTDETGGGTARRRRPRALTATVAAVAVVLCLWGGVAAVRGGGSDAVTGARLPAPPGTGSPVDDGAGSADATAEPDTGPGPPAPSSAPVPAETVAPPAPSAPAAEPPPAEAGGGDGAEGPGWAGGAPPASGGAAAPEGGGEPEQGGGDDAGAGGGDDTEEPGGEDGEGDLDGGSEPGRRGPLSELVGGLLGLLGGSTAPER